MAFKKINNTGNPDEDYQRLLLGAKVNHSDNPNLILQYYQEYYLYAAKTSINQNDELTIDYSIFPWEGKREFTKYARFRYFSYLINFLKKTY